MKVWHGSYTAIEKVDLAFAGKKKDFGRGFYVTNLREQAETWAKLIGDKKIGESGVVTEFDYKEFMTSEMDMKVLRFDGYTDEWLDFVVLNRRNESDAPAHDYDLVEGPVADDQITRQVDRFIAGLITREKFLSKLVYNPSHQICFCTVKSLQALSLPKGRVDVNMYDIADAVVEALMSEFGYSETAAADLYYTSQTYALVSDESTGYYKKPWQEIYEMLRAELKI